VKEDVRKCRKKRCEKNYDRVISSEYEMDPSIIIKTTTGMKLQK
jgi:hypothetical protein